MDNAGINRAALVGQSMGCEIVVEATIRDPARVTRLVLIAPTPDPAARKVWKQFTRLVRGGFYEKPSLMYLLLKDYLRMGRRVIPEFWSMLHYPMEEKLPQIHLPTMLVRGQNDPVIPQGWFEEAALLVRADRTTVIPRWGHAVQYSAARQLTEAIRPFLAS
jgi:2-hydroxy-6-oxonona-2,4-dienedioate hydrolase